MPITLKNITPADTLSSMVDKINFNFDQIILNGGGIEGPEGPIGYPGMQGVQGQKGENGNVGEKGDRGALWLKLSSSNIETALIDGFSQNDIRNMYDQIGEDIKEGDILVSIIENDNTSENEGDTASKLYKIKKDTGTSTGTGFKPEFFANFVPNEYFTEYGLQGCSHTLVHTMPSSDENKRGFILNDYSGGFTATDSLINEIINNNAAVVYTESNLAENSIGSPNSGLVFIKPGEYDQLEDYPRINYVKSNNNTENKLNIYASNANIELTSGNNIAITGKSISCEIGSGSGEDFEIFKNDSVTANKFTFIKTHEENNQKIISLNSDKIEIGNIIDGSNVSLIDIEYDETYSKIKFNKNDNRIIFKSNLSIQEDTVDGIQDRLKFYKDNTTGQYSSHLNTGNVFLGTNHNSMGISIYSHGENDKKRVEISSSHFITSEDPNYLCRITLNNDDVFHQNIIMQCPRFGSVLMSNISEEYGPSIINLSSDSSSSNTTKFTVDSVWDTGSSNIRYKTAYFNAYDHLHITTFSNIKSLFAGSLQFKGKGVSAETNQINAVTYNFVKVGNIVHCQFHGTINPTYMTCANSTNRHILLSNSTQYKTCYYSGDRFRLWSSMPTTSGRNEGGIISATGIIPAGGTTLTLAYPYSIILELFPPIIEITNVDNDENEYRTNVKNLNGNITISCNNTTSTGELVYSSDIITHSTHGSDEIYKLPTILARSMYNAINSSGRLNTGSYTFPTTAGKIILPGNGSSNNTSKYIEFNGQFSYIIDIDEIHHTQIGDNDNGRYLPTNTNNSTGTGTGTNAGTETGSVDYNSGTTDYEFNSGN